MGGRGRGRGAPDRPKTSFTYDQLNAMGLTGAAGRAEMMAGSSGPPPTFPAMLNKAAPLKIDSKEQYLIKVKRGFVEHLRESAIFKMAPTEAKSIFQPYGNRLVEIVSEIKPDTNFPWSHLPSELRPDYEKRKLTSVKAKSKRRAGAVDIDVRLKQLEQRELKGNKDDEKGNENEKATDDAENEIIEDDDQPDEEMDIGTDYGNDYFDNGEAFDEEDDALDEPFF